MEFLQQRYQCERLINKEGSKIQKLIPTKEWGEPFDFDLFGWDKATATLLAGMFTDNRDSIFGRLAKLVDPT